MSSPGGSSTGPGSRRAGLLWIVFVAAIVIAIVTVVVIGMASSGNQASPSASSAPRASHGAGSTGSPTPTPTAGTGASAPGTSAPEEPPIVVADPIPLEATAEPDPGVTVSVGTFESVQGEAQLAGDVAGPAIRFTVSITNGTAAPVSLSTALVNVYYGSDQSPASELQKPGGAPLPADVAAGATATGTFVFTVPEGERNNVLITVDYRVGDPVIAFQGAVPQ
ncbi:MAG: hypothetical protein JWM23_1335 [Microbacteriaceae bacterium]|jgi:hypothetical protein|nr:hypothetical protein [Microbacteriaceae bacterium]